MARKVFIDSTGFEINPEIIGEGITQSEMQCWDNCPEKWYLGYNHMLHRVGKFSWALTFGSWMHGALQEFYTSKGKRWSLDTKIREKHFIHQDLLVQEDLWRGTAQVMMDVYTSLYKHDFKVLKPVAVEEVVDIVFEGIRLKGMIDLFAKDLTVKKDEYYVWDHKTTFKLDASIILGWDFRFQFMFYCWIAGKVEKWKKFHCNGFVINAIRKPVIKPNKNETLDGYLQRLQSDMLGRPEFYFHRDKLILKQGDMEHFENNILRPKLQRIRLLLDPKVDPKIKEFLIRNKNTDHCVSKFGQACEFLPACQHGLDVEGMQYRRREVKHQELMAEVEE